VRGTIGWSPDGAWIVYSSDRDGDDGSLWAIAASGGTPIQITDDPTYNGGAHFRSPDGAGSPPPRIAFESERSGNLDIWVIDAPCVLFGDLDGDGDVDIADIMLGASPAPGAPHLKPLAQSTKPPLGLI